MDSAIPIGFVLVAVGLVLFCPRELTKELKVAFETTVGLGLCY